MAGIIDIAVRHSKMFGLAQVRNSPARVPLPPHPGEEANDNRSGDLPEPPQDDPSFRGGFRFRRRLGLRRLARPTLGENRGPAYFRRVVELQAIMRRRTTLPGAMAGAQLLQHGALLVRSCDFRQGQQFLAAKDKTAERALRPECPGQRDPAPLRIAAFAPTCFASREDQLRQAPDRIFAD